MTRTVVQFKCSPEEKARLVADASLAGLKVSPYIRRELGLDADAASERLLAKQRREAPVVPSAPESQASREAPESAEAQRERADADALRGFATIDHHFDEVEAEVPPELFTEAELDAATEQRIAENEGNEPYDAAREACRVILTERKRRELRS